MDKNTNALGIAPIGKLLRQFSVPAIISILVSTIYSATDRWFISQTVGTDGVAALSVAGPLFMLYISFDIMLGIGGNALFSIKLGQKDNDGARAVLANTFLLQLLFSLAFGVFGTLYLEEMMNVSGGSEKTIPLAVQYMGVLAPIVFLSMVGNGLNNFVRSSGHPKRAMMNSISAVLLNVFLDWLLMVQFNMGMRGAAIATACSMALTFGLVLQFFLSRRAPVRLKLGKPSGAILKTIVLYGISPFLLHLTFAADGLIVNNMFSKFSGDMPIAAWGIVMTITQFCFMPVFGITQGMQSIAGYNFGARKWDRVKKVVKLTFAYVSAWLVLTTVAVLAFGDFFVGLFNDGSASKELLDFAKWALHICIIPYPLFGLLFVTAVYMLSTGQYKKSLFLNIGRQVFFRFPALFIMAALFGLHGVIYSFAISDTLAIILGAIMLRQEWKKINRRIAAEERVLASGGKLVKKRTKRKP